MSGDTRVSGDAALGGISISATRETTRRATRLGAVCYLNTKPLVFGLDANADFAVRFDVPSKCAELLEAGETDLGLIPSFEYAQHDDYLIVPHLAIASQRAVESVAMFTTRPIAEIKTIALDTSSRTSANLLRLLCAAWFKITPTFTPAAPDLDAMLRDNDAALLIGDPALFANADAAAAADINTDASADAAIVASSATTAQRQQAVARRPVQKIDLGQTWFEMTGLPFVWAFWAGRADAADAHVSRALRQTRDRGLAHVDDIARREAPTDAARQALITRYLTQTISFDLDGTFATGLRTYYALLAEHGLIARRAELRFFAE